MNVGCCISTELPMILGNNRYFHGFKELMILRRHLTWHVLSHRPKTKILIILMALVATLLGLVAPYFQKLFLDIMLGHHTASFEPRVGGTTNALIIVITVAFLAMILTQGVTVLLRILCAKAGAQLQNDLSREIHLHSLRLTGLARSTKTVGEMVNFYTQDVSAAVALIEDFLPSLLASIIPFIVAPLAVHYYFDLPVDEIFAMLFASCGCLLLMSYRQSKFFSAFKRLAGERLAVVNEWLQNMRIIRVLGWMKAFEYKIHVKRIEETDNRLKMVTNGSIMNSIAQVAPLLVNVVGVATLIHYRHDDVMPGDIFALLWIFGVFMARPIRNMPWNLVIFLDGQTSCRRLERFFKMPEEPHGHWPPTSVHNARSGTDHGPAVDIKGLNLQIGERVILKDIHFQAGAGEFVAIIGEVGSGKTQFLLSLLRDTPAVFDSYTIGDFNALRMTLPELRDWFSYVPQDGFTMSSSLRDNVAFTYDFASTFDQDIIQSLNLADFNPLQERLESGLATDIGERGVNLSGGQRQRVGLARAHFHHRNLILLDDTLSAVDVDTEQELIKNLLTGAWKHCTRILITHRLSVLEHADRVYVMEHGRLKPRDG